MGSYNLKKKDVDSKMIFSRIKNALLLLKNKNKVIKMGGSITSTSKNFIENFFNPFFGGVFLEKKLNTSAKFFKFVFSQFNNGTVCVPKEGMQKIPNQIYKKLKPIILNILCDASQ